MNPRAAHVALVLVAIGGVAFVAFLLLVGGCRAGLPPEPGYVVTSARDAGRP